MRSASEDAAFISGSAAKGRDNSGSEIDLMVISDSLRYADRFGEIHAAEELPGTRPARPPQTAPWRAGLTARPPRGATSRNSSGSRARVLA